MVKSRFPGKPAKYFHRKKVSSSVHNQDYEGSKAAEDIYNRLNIFKSVFGTEDEVSSFHGFSPHEVELAAKKANSNYKALKKELKDRGLSVEVLKEPESLTIYKSVNKELRSFKECSKTNNLLKTVQQQKESDIICLDGVTKSVSADCNKSEVDSRTSVLDKNEESNCNKITSNVSTLSGKFVLPTRSAHSSRVIKPNKRFIQSDSNSVPIKKTRPTHKKDFATGESDSVCEKSNKEISYERKVNMESLFGENSAGHRKHKRLGLLTQSPVKVILRKPRLNIKSESYTSVEGPFSSSSSSTLGNQGSQKQAQVPAKVVCGVCGSIRLYKFLKQARKFGIFSCEPCRRFILKILKMERQKTLQPLNCISGNGTCRIRHSALESSQMFSTELSQKKFHGDGPRRCQGCWLNLCLKSFNVPHEVYTRLVSYLPKIYPKKSTPGFSNTGGQWADTSLGLGTLGVSPALTYIGPSRSLSYELAKSIKRKATAIARRDPTTLPNNFNATNQGISKDMKESSRIKLRQKLQVPGPRVKHVCRSASLVLGQPAATFIPAVKNSTFEMKKPKSDGGIPIKQQSRSIEREDVSTSPKTSKGDVEILSVQEEHVKPKDVSGPPIARMLQDLGRVNWELLDGIEKQETELLHAKVSIDFWESYDPEEVSQTGFSLLGFGKFRLRALCFLCGSAGQDKLLHCASCCEPYHTYCVSNLKLTNNTKEWWKVDWLCPRCTYCVSCRKAGGVQLTCAKCSQSYHTACISTARCNVTENNWLCSSCLCCKSCNDTSVHVFVGNLPLCKACFKLRKRGSFCPLCQRCYDDNDYSTKMMECAQCKSWIHAKCEGLSNEKYQVLSYLPSSIEFICRLCCKSPPALWSLAIDSELKAGYLNVLKVLSKNRSACALLKSSPKKQTVCTCQDSHRRPIHLPDLSDQQESSICKEKDLISSPAIDDKNSDFGLLTPKMTKDDEESLKTVKSGFLSLVNEKNSQSSEKEDGKCNLRECAVKNLPEESLSSKSTESGCDRQLLSIAYHRIDAKGSQLSPHAMSQSDSGIGSTDDEQKCSVDDSTEARQNSNEKNCPCYCKHISAKTSLNLLSIKNKANSDEYTSLLQFHQDMEQVIEGVRAVDLLKIYHKALKQVFPWFDPKESQICVSHPDIDLHVVMNIQNKLDEVQPKRNSSSTNSINNSFKGLLDMDQDYYYSGLKINDTRICMLCKSLGEGLPTKEERLLYCGNNEWVHGNCALWSSEVFEEIDGSLQNVQSAISRARLIRCNGCSKKGASIGCCARSCSVAYHFSCALLADCIFLENKEVYCQNHRHLTESKEHHKEKDFPISRSIYVELDHRKRKDVPKHQVKLIIGSLYVEDFGTVVPEFSDRDDLIIPCDFKCTRLYWSCIEPWKIVQYHIKTSIQQSSSEYLSENDINYTVDHSLDFTPPPSPVDTVVFENLNRTVEEKDVKSVIGHILDVICSKEEESNLSVDQQATDLLPPELKDAIFEDLPHDILDGISVNDIFHKMMNFDDVISAEIKNDKSEASPETENLNLDSNHKRQKSDEEGSGTKQTTISFTKNNLNSFKSQGSCNSHLNSYCRLRSSGRHKEVDKKAEGENLIERGKENKWKRKSILQVDGTVDCSESEHSNDSCDFGSTLRSNLVAEKTVCTSNVSYLGGVIKSDNPTDDKPVKCTRCHRTYRTSVGFDRHLSTCNSDDYFSCSESDSSEEEKSTGADDMIITDTMAVEVVVQNVQPELVFTSDQCEMVTEANVMNSHISFQQSAYNGTNGITENLISEVSHVEFGKVPAAVNVTLIESKTKSIDDSNLSLQSKRQRVPKCYNVKKKTTNSVISNHMPQHILHSSPTSHQQSVVEIQSANSGNSAIILQPINTESVIPAYIESYQQHNHPSIQYVTTIDTQEKAQYLAPDPLVPGTYHIQSAPIAQPVVQNLPTVLGTIIQPNGMEQIVVNNPNPGIEVYNPQQSSVFITNSPVYVGMETVVSNTVMSSSQFISSSIPGMLAASSYSATTTQVFQATKPILDIPQSYVVVNTHQPLLENPPPPPAPPPPPPPPCIPQIFSNQSLPQQPIPWANYQVNFQEAYKMDKSSSYQTVTRQIIHEAKDLDGVKMINSTQETIVIEPLSTAPKITEIRHDVDKIDGPVKELSKLVSQISSSASGNFDRPQSSQIKGNFVKLVELPSSSAIDREKPQQAVAPVVVKKIVANGPEYVKRDKSELPTSSIKTLENSIKGVVNKKENFENFANANTIGNRIVQYSNIRNEIKEILIPKSRGLVEPRRILKPVIRHKNSSAPFNFNKEQLQKKTIVKEEPKITYEITSDDGFSYTTTNVLEAWKKVFETVQIAREGKGLPLLTQNPFSSPDSMLKKMMGLGNNGMKYILEQLPGIGRCVKYKSVYHKKELSALEHELSRSTVENPSGCARTEPFNSRHKYDMFSWLASRHRRPPKLLNSDSDLNVNSRRATSSNLPMAMRFRHLKETSKQAVGVFRSDIHGRGLFCLRDIESGEMVIEYAGEVIRSVLTDLRERYYTSKGIGCYMFRIDDKFVVDATMKGNAARFINHSCEPNCYSRVVDILGKKHILIFALRRIPQGEELTYDYKFPLEEEKINCHCLSRKCRKYLN